MKVFKTRFLIYIFFTLLISCQQAPPEYRTQIDLSGEWQFALDSLNVGEHENWFSNDLSEIVQLPGTTDENQKGRLNHDITTMHLNRIYIYEGIAWYRRKITIPENLKDKYLQLFLERTKSTTIWIDDKQVGGSHLLQSPQVFDVSKFMTPGDHSITIRVDNTLALTPYGNVHIYSDDTQTNWNGILGEIKIDASSPLHLTNLQVFPDVKNKKFHAELEIANPENIKQGIVELWLTRSEDGKSTQLKTLKKDVSLDSKINLEYELGNDCQLWDEYQHPLYELTAVVSAGKEKDSRSTTFGMRNFAVDSTQFSINGRKIFLRGKHEAAVFPLTGHPPMDMEGWERVFNIAKTYGINHYRFHSYCPPEAAFTAADKCGIYLQAELPFWGGLESDAVAEMLLKEGKAMLKSYANHPSFVLFSHGNEIWSGHDNVEKNIITLEKYDSRPLFTMGCNNNIGFVSPRECSEYYVGARTPYAYDTILTHTRLTHAFADSKDGGILNTQIPSTTVNFDYAVEHMNIPIISHEIGQYQIYPNYNEIKKYTGVLEARNLEVFRNRLKKVGMLDEDSLFQQASGHWSALCYKAEMEAALRTKGLAGFQLLDLQDFPGQGTALVGILDAFMDSKGVVTPESWKQSCNDVVLLPEFSKFCWTNNGSFQSKIMVANYSAAPVNGDVKWQINHTDGTIFEEGTFSSLEIRNEGLSEIGSIEVALNGIQKAEQLTFKVQISGIDYSNEYPLWVYPASNIIEVPADILVTESLNQEVLNQLQAGQKVLYFPKTKDIKQKSVPGLFPPEFWNYEMFKQISESNRRPVSPGTLGILTNPEHPIFKYFPTDFYTDWQWFSIVKASNSLILDGTSKDYRPIVQIIDNLQRNQKLGMIFEFKVGEGKLLVCTSQLRQIQDKPEAVQLYKSMMDYMGSKTFNPSYVIEENDLKALF
ncbi:MAG TPA: glycoside hydrolase family 2 TIM barrel-domain containing protein [Draconibacterium sp.]|nr:glycoside hydrolase family 2 TIM barrel-domain containing protein [Draconibacterium sp.]